MNDNQTDVFSLPYAKWLEDTLQEMIKYPVKGIALNAITDNGEIYTNYYKITMADKLIIAGVVQQDAMFDSLAANGVIDYADEEEDVDGEEED
jgi:hypothetical protein